jgi:hypothetical protein
MPANPFDQFDAPAQAGNPFDQFDNAPAAQTDQLQPSAPAAPVDTRPVGDLDTLIREPALTLGTSMFSTPVSGLAGLGTLATNAVGLTDADPSDVISRVQGALTYRPRTKAGQVGTNAISYPFQKLAEFGDWSGQKAADATGSPAVGAGVNTAIQFAAPTAFAKGLKAVRVPGNVSRTAPVDSPVVAGEAPEAAPVAKTAERASGLEKVPDSAPTIEQLKTDAKAAYKRAEDAGINISEGSFKGLKAKIVKDIGERVDPTLHPDTTAALKRILGSKGDISLSKLDQLRQIASDAKGSVKPADQRLASQIVDSIDDYVDNLSQKDVTAGDAKAASALSEARSLYQRQKKAETIDNLIKRAEISAPNFSASGMENALRTEFRSLAKNDKQMKRFTPEERAAIIKVAKGGPVENTLRMIGKLSPEGAIPIMANLAAASATGGSSLALTGAAWGARRGATHMTLKNANAASEVMRRGPQKNALAEVPKPEKRNALLEY